MCTSAEDCRCHEHVRQSFSPNSLNAQRRISSADMASKSRSGRGGALCKQDLLQRVAPEPEPKRLERDHLVGRDVAEIDTGSELLHEPRLRALRRRLEDEVLDRDLV